MVNSTFRQPEKSKSINDIYVLFKCRASSSGVLLRSRSRQPRSAYLTSPRYSRFAESSGSEGSKVSIMIHQNPDTARIRVIRRSNGHLFIQNRQRVRKRDEREERDKFTFEALQATRSAGSIKPSYHSLKQRS